MACIWRTRLLLENEVGIEIKNVNEFLGKNICKKAVVFVEEELLNDAPKKYYDKIEFLPILDGDNVSALSKIVY